MVVGFDKFKEYFESFRDEFIIIGGTAVQMVCGEAVAHPRVTKDIEASARCVYACCRFGS